MRGQRRGEQMRAHESGESKTVDRQTDRQTDRQARREKREAGRTKKIWPKFREFLQGAMF